MKRISLHTPKALWQIIAAVLSAGISSAILYGIYSGGMKFGLFLVFIAFQGIFYSFLVAPLLWIMLKLGMTRFINILGTSTFAVGLIFFMNWYNLCPNGVTADIGLKRICENGHITYLGWQSILLASLHGIFLGFFGGLVFWWLAPKEDVNSDSLGNVESEVA